LEMNRDFSLEDAPRRSDGVSGLYALCIRRRNLQCAKKRAA
jgi:hypothetical protein